MYQTHFGLTERPFGLTPNTGFYYGANIYAGSKLSGMINESGNLLKPDGPYNNAAYKINITGSQIGLSTGGRDAFNTPIYRNLGYYHFSLSYSNSTYAIDYLSNESKYEEKSRSRN